jgi:hypothetical protein
VKLEIRLEIVERVIRRKYIQIDFAFKFIRDRLKVKRPKMLKINSIGCSFKFIHKVGVEKSIVNLPQITDQLFRSNLTFFFYSAY